MCATLSACDWVIGCEPVGFAIVGSRYVRQFCDRCGAAIRVPKANLHKLNYCERCGERFGEDMKR